MQQLGVKSTQDVDSFIFIPVYLSCKKKIIIEVLLYSELANLNKSYKNVILQHGNMHYMNIIICEDKKRDF